MSVTPSIFKAYDVRGIYPDEFDESVAELVGQAFVTYLDAKRLAVARDMRLSSNSLAAAFIEGARTQGADIVDYGLASTDMLYYGVSHEKHDGGAMITASHNPKEYNGIKLVGRQASALSGDEGIASIRDMVIRHNIPSPTSTRGTLSQAQLLDQYVSHVLSFTDTSIIKPFRLVLDAGSGMAGVAAPSIFDSLPCQTTRLCFEIDGSFPNHEANPLIEANRKHLVSTVVDTQADLGIAWDGDADRCFFVDENGQFVPGDFVTTLLAEAFLLKHPGSTIIYDVRASHAVPNTVDRLHGKPLINRVGHAFFKKRMRETNAIFGGEVTGHYYFRDNAFADNGLIPALLILELLSKHGTSLVELLAPLRSRYFISGEINTTVQDMSIIPTKLDQISACYADATQHRIDGLSIEYPDWHFNLRGSNTEPLFRLNLEANKPSLMADKRDEVLSLIRAG